MNFRQRPKTEPLIDLTGWDIPPERVESLPGQRSLFDGPAASSKPSDEEASRREGELFETGHDLPGAGETAQSLLWDIE